MRYSRNRVRLGLMPYLASLNPQAAQHISHLAELAAEDASFLNHAARATLEELTSPSLPWRAVLLDGRLYRRADTRGYVEIDKLGLQEWQQQQQQVQSEGGVGNNPFAQQQGHAPGGLGRNSYSQQQQKQWQQREQQTSHEVRGRWQHSNQQESLQEAQQQQQEAEKQQLAGFSRTDVHQLLQSQLGPLADLLQQLQAQQQQEVGHFRFQQEQHQPEQLQQDLERAPWQHIWESSPVQLLSHPLGVLAAAALPATATATASSSGTMLLCCSSSNISSGSNRSSSSSSSSSSIGNSSSSSSQVLASAAVAAVAGTRYGSSSSTAEGDIWPRAAYSDPDSSSASRRGRRRKTSTDPCWGPAPCLAGEAVVPVAKVEGAGRTHKRGKGKGQGRGLAVPICSDAERAGGGPQEKCRGSSTGLGVDHAVTAAAAVAQPGFSRGPVIGAFAFLVDDVPARCGDAMQEAVGSTAGRPGNSRESSSRATSGRDSSTSSSNTSSNTAGSRRSTAHSSGGDDNSSGSRNSERNHPVGYRVEVTEHGFKMEISIESVGARGSAIEQAANLIRALSREAATISRFGERAAQLLTPREGESLQGALPMPIVRELHPALQSRVIRLWLKDELGITPSYEMLKGVMRLLGAGKGSKMVSVGRGIRIVRKGEWLEVEKRM